jgi:Ni,Fe-hydrogenase III small subunit/ferredoxin
MLKTLLDLMARGIVTQRDTFPPLPEYARGLPSLSAEPCTDCGACEAACPTDAIRVEAPRVELDLGCCIACGECVKACPTGTIQTDRRTDVAVRCREDLVLRSPHLAPPAREPQSEAPPSWRRSLAVRVVSCGDSASDLEVAASQNAIFDGGRFGISVVASPRYADALVVTGPVGLAMHEPLRRCWEAMAEPRVVVAVGASAISGGVHAGGYASANGVDAILPVAVYVPGHPPHPWSVLHGLFLAMGRAR